MNSSKKWIVVGICLVFIAGLFAGIVTERRFLNCHPRPGKEKKEKFSRKEALDRLTTDLSLNSEQKQSIDRIFEKHRPEFEAVHKQVGEKLTKLMDQMDKEIMRVLNDQQKKKFIKSIEERKKHHQDDRH
jgi:hypothetical protein